MADKRTIFYDKLYDLLKESSNRSLFIEEERYKIIVQEVKEAQLLKKNKQSLSSKQYRRLKRYDVVRIGNTEKLIECRLANSTDDSKIRYYCKTDELFEILEQTHIKVGHKRTRVMEIELKKKYCNCTRQIINMYLSLCESCQLKKKIPKTDLVVTPPNLTNYMNYRCQVDLIDMQSEPDGKYRFIMNYQDHLTKFTILRPLMTNTAEEVAHQLLDIFCLFGAPYILQSDNSCKFAKKIIQNLADLWPEMKLVYGKPRHFQSPDLVKNSNQDIHDMLVAWKTENNSENWSNGLSFIQSKRNRTLHSSIKRSPHESMFGVPQKMGLVDLNLSSSVYHSIETEEELEKLVSSVHNNDNQKLTLKPLTEFENEKNNSVIQYTVIKTEDTEQDVSNTNPLYICNEFIIDTEIKTKEVKQKTQNIEGEAFEHSYSHKDLINTENNIIKCENELSTSLTLHNAISCHCKRYCIDKKCKCLAKNIKCNAKCHKNSSCKNK